VKRQDEGSDDEEAAGDASDPRPSGRGSATVEFDGTQR
jgi:hypothetical protein